MSKLILIKNHKIVRNAGKSNEQTIRFDNCDRLSAVSFYRDLDKQNDEKEYDVRMSFDNVSFTAAFAKFEDAERFMTDLVTYLQNDMTFLELDLLNYESN